MSHNYVHFVESPDTLPKFSTSEHTTDKIVEYPAPLPKVSTSEHTTDKIVEYPAPLPKVSTSELLTDKIVEYPAPLPKVSTSELLTDKIVEYPEPFHAVGSPFVAESEPMYDAGSPFSAAFFDQTPTAVAETEPEVAETEPEPEPETVVTPLPQLRSCFVSIAPLVLVEDTISCSLSLPAVGRYYGSTSITPMTDCGFDLDDDSIDIKFVSPTQKRKELPESDADAGLKKECAKCGSMEHALSTTCEQCGKALYRGLELPPVQLPAKRARKVPPQKRLKKTSIIENEFVPTTYPELYARWTSDEGMSVITSDIAVQLSQNYGRACLALPDFFDHMGFQFSCGCLRDQLVRKDRHTSDFAGTSEKAKELRNDLRLRLLSFKDVAPEEAIELDATRYTDCEKQQLVEDARDASPSNNDLTNRTFLFFLRSVLLAEELEELTANQHRIATRTSSLITYQTHLSATIGRRL